MGSCALGAAENVEEFWKVLSHLVLERVVPMRFQGLSIFESLTKGLNSTLQGSSSLIGFRLIKVLPKRRLAPNRLRFATLLDAKVGG